MEAPKCEIEQCPYVYHARCDGCGGLYCANHIFWSKELFFRGWRCVNCCRRQVSLYNRLFILTTALILVSVMIAVGIIFFGGSSFDKLIQTRGTSSNPEVLSFLISCCCCPPLFTPLALYFLSMSMQQKRFNKKIFRV